MPGPPHPPRIGLVTGPLEARTVAALSGSALDRPLSGAAELTVGVVLDDAVLQGAFQRGAGVLRRGSGGPEVRVGPGTVYVGLALESPAALLPCDESRIVNRHVRPLLRALGRAGAVAHFFGRDWVSVAHRPVAWVGFAHDATSHRTVFEAFVAVRTPFALSGRASFLGKPQGTLESVTGTAIDEARLVGAIVDAYTRDAEVLPQAPPDLRVSPVQTAPPWTAMVEEAIGPLGAGPDAAGVFRVGGDLLVSRDALARLEARAANASKDDLGRVLDDTLAAPGVALDGVRSLTSIRDVIVAARGL
jgi:hypothetical protein